MAIVPCRFAFLLTILTSFASTMFLYLCMSYTSNMNTDVGYFPVQVRGFTMNFSMIPFDDQVVMEKPKCASDPMSSTSPELALPNMNEMEEEVSFIGRNGDISNNSSEPFGSPDLMLETQGEVSLEWVNDDDENNQVIPREELLVLNLTMNNETREREPFGGVNDDVFHDRDVFLQDYREMNRSLKIYVYPHKKNDPFAAVFLPVSSEPTGNYASESFFKRSLFRSHFFTEDPSEADLFYLPFSITALRNDRRVGVGGIKKFVRDYVADIRHRYPYWNRTAGADHFYVVCHSVGRTAMEKAVDVKLNAIQAVCSSSYFVPGYIPHKDAPIPQIWPRKGRPPVRSPSKRKTLAFYAGAMNSPVRKSLVETWEHDGEISVHRSRVKTPYSEALMSSKFCIHAKGFEVNTARAADAIFYGCVPVIVADYYELPFSDILNWSSFSVVLPAADIPKMKKVLGAMAATNEYLEMHRNVIKVQRHFTWYNSPVDYDAFHLVMYQLWLRRSRVKVLFD